MIKVITSINYQINQFVWGPVTLAILLGFGLYITVRTGFFQFTKIKDIADNTICREWTELRLKIWNHL